MVRGYHFREVAEKNSRNNNSYHHLGKSTLSADEVNVDSLNKVDEVFALLLAQETEQEITHDCD